MSKTMNLYVPLLVHFNSPGEPWNDLNELEETNGTYYVDDISNAVKKSMNEMGKQGLANDIHGSTRGKIISVTADVTEQNDQLFGVIRFETYEELSSYDIGLLTMWAYEEMAGEWSSQFENQAIPVEDGEVYVSFYNELYDYTIETEDEFFGNPNQGINMT